MPHLMIPETASAKIALFRQAATQIDKMTEEKQIELHPNLVDRLRRQADLLEQTLQGLATLRQTRVPLREAERVRGPQLEMLIRHFYAALKNRIRREPQGLALQTLFDISGQSIEEARDRPLRLLELAEKIIKAEALAISQGFAPSHNPAVSDLEPWLLGARETRERLLILTRQLKESAARRNQLNQEAHQLARELLARLKVEFIHLPNPTQRQLIRTFGFQARYPNKEPQPKNNNPASKTKVS